MKLSPIPHLLSINDLPSIMPLPSAIEHNDRLYCIVPDTELRSFQNSVPAGIQSSQPHVFVVEREGVDRAYDWLARMNHWKDPVDVFKDTCKPAMGSLKIEAGILPIGSLHSVHGGVYRAVMHTNGNTALLPANAPEMLIYGMVTGKYCQLAIDVLTGSLANYSDCMNEIKSWKRGDGIPQLSRSANGAIQALSGWYHYKNNDEIRRLVIEALADLINSIPGVRHSNAMLIDIYGNEAFEIEDIFEYHRKNNFR